MNAANRRFDIYLGDILISISRINEYIGEMDFVEFKRNYLIVDAVVRNFEIIGGSVEEHSRKNSAQIPICSLEKNDWIKKPNLA